MDLEKAEEPEIKLLTSVRSQKKQENPRKTPASASLTTLKPLTVCITTVENSSRDGNTKLLYLSPEKSVCWPRSNSENRHGTMDCFQIGKGVHQGCILSPCLFNLYAEYIMGNARLDETQAGIKIARKNINNLRYGDDTTLTTKSEELKSLLMKVKEESEKAGLIKLNIQETKIMASGPITSWQIDGETMETVTDFILGGSRC